MFGEMLAEYLQWEPAALQEELERLELAARELDSRRLAVRAAAEARQTAALDGHKSTQALLRALCNQPSNVAMAEVRRARICRDFPQVGDLLMAGRIGVGQIDELVRIRRNARADPYLDAAADGRHVARPCRASAGAQLRRGCRAMVDVGRPGRGVARSDRLHRQSQRTCGRQRR